MNRDFGFMEFAIMEGGDHWMMENHWIHGVSILEYGNRLILDSGVDIFGSNDELLSLLSSRSCFQQFAVLCLHSNRLETK